MKTLRVALALALVACLEGCSRYYEPHLLYKGTFAEGSIDDVAAASRRLGEENGLVVDERWYRFDLFERRGVVAPPGLGRKFSQWMYRDAEALERDRKALSVSSSAGAVTLAVMDAEYSGMATQRLDDLADRFREMLGSRFGIRFCRANPVGGCDDEYARLEAARWTTVRPDDEPGYAPRRVVLQYRARYDPEEYGMVEQAMDGLAARRGLRVLVHPTPWAGHGGRRPSGAGPAMTTFYLGVRASPNRSLGIRETVLSLSNELVATTLDLSAYGDRPEAAREDVERLALEAKALLEREFGLSFCRVNPAKFLCDETYARLEAERVEAESGTAAAGPRRQAGPARTPGGSDAPPSMEQRDGVAP